MTNANKNKGSQFERDVRDFLREHGFPQAERAYGAGRSDDVGDIAGVPRAVLECKNAQRYLWTPWLAETAIEAVNGRKPYGFLVVKRPRLSASEALFVTTLENGAKVLRELHGDTAQ